MTRPSYEYDPAQQQTSDDDSASNPETAARPPPSQCKDEMESFLPHQRSGLKQKQGIACWGHISYPVATFLALITVILTAVILLATTGKHRPMNCVRPLDWSGYQCAPTGAPPDVARHERNCEFDTMSFHWWPAAAVRDPDNQALLAAFHAEGKQLGHKDMGRWGRFYSKAGKVEIPPDTDYLTSGWVTRMEHLVHCKYTLRQTHLWAIKGFDPPFDYNHTMHCTQYLMDAVLENRPVDWDDLIIQGTPWPEQPPIVSH
ncbi:hypothetical protein N0V82_005153 [Gnomoniopsis sp. IMI 355080]|nr:hypothetical protein N0V82_005153 [Gnomoniopsis sp. IMI 355080]